MPPLFVLASLQVPLDVLADLLYNPPTISIDPKPRTRPALLQNQHLIFRPRNGFACRLSIKSGAPRAKLGKRHSQSVAADEST